MPHWRIGRSEVGKIKYRGVRCPAAEGRDLSSTEKAGYPGEVAADVLRFALALVREEYPIEVSLKYKVSKVLFFVGALQQLARAQAASSGEIKEQRITQQMPYPLARQEVSLGQEGLPVLVVKLD